MVIAGFLLGIASLLEAPTGVAIFAILNVALFLSFLMEIDQETSIRAIVGFLVGFLLVVFPMIYSYFISNVNLAAHVLAIKEWYQFLIVRSPGDGLLSFTLWKYGPNIFSLIILYFAVRPVANLAFTERLLIGIIIVFMLILLVEILHAQGVFLEHYQKSFFPFNSSDLIYCFPLCLLHCLGRFICMMIFLRIKMRGNGLFYLFVTRWLFFYFCK